MQCQSTEKDRVKKKYESNLISVHNVLNIDPIQNMNFINEIFIFPKQKLRELSFLISIDVELMTFLVTPKYILMISIENTYIQCEITLFVSSN